MGCRGPRGNGKANSEEGVEGHHEGEAPLEGQGDTATGEMEEAGNRDLGPQTFPINRGTPVEEETTSIL